MGLKNLVTVILITMALTVLSIAVAGTRTNSGEFKAAATYKSKCVACHGPKAEKKFDTAKPDAEHVQLILKGKKMPKPPHMPGYETKGITPEKAQALLDYMKSLRL
jgi:mono/diheme cytochrome c family protein